VLLLDNNSLTNLLAFAELLCRFGLLLAQKFQLFHLHCIKGDFPLSVRSQLIDFHLNLEPIDSNLAKFFPPEKNNQNERSL